MSNVNLKEELAGLILIVEDEALLRIHAAALLEDEGYCVVEATDADAALQMLESRQDWCSPTSRCPATWMASTSRGRSIGAGRTSPSS